MVAENNFRHARPVLSLLCLAALAIGADGVIVEVHPDPDKAWSDGAQSLTFENFGELMNGLKSPLKTVAVAAPSLVM